MRSSTMAMDSNKGPQGRPERAQPEPSTGPWWRHGMMWLVVGGPAVVVVAAIVTAVIAIRGADIVVDETGAPRGARAEAYVPAMKARNHAATPAQSVPAAEPAAPTKAPE